MGRLMYVNKKGTFYWIMDQKLYSINSAREPESLVKDLKESCYKVSESNAFFA